MTQATRSRKPALIARWRGRAYLYVIPFRPCAIAILANLERSVPKVARITGPG